MGKGVIAEVGGIGVATATGSGIMIGRRGVTCSAVSVADGAVIEGSNIAEIGGVGVTTATGSGIVISRRRVAGRTIGIADNAVIEAGVTEVAGIAVTIATCSRIMI